MKQQRIHLLLVEDGDLDAMTVHCARSPAPKIASITVDEAVPGWFHPIVMDAMRWGKSVAELAPPVLEGKA